ncbi:MAG: periplasmic sensor signal transduction histidine kinase [Chloroflexi bacterium]|nr:periplasmic sensor signal transduction histidine kinase [Chloroflexota bacterium]
MPLRLRLTVLNALVIASAICLLGAFTYLIEARSLAEELDESLRSQGRILVNIYQVRAGLSPRTRERILPQPNVFAGPSFHVQVIDPDGEIMDRSAELGARRLPVKEQTLLRAGDNEQVFETVRLEGQNVRLLTVPLVAEEEFLGYIQVARSLETIEDALEFLARSLLGVGAVLLVLTLAVSWALAVVSLSPIGRITQAAREVTRSGRLDRRLPPPRSRDEIGRLAETFNRMMDRLEGAFAAQRRFIADASHELRTPLTTVRGNLELLRRQDAVSDPAMREALTDVIDEAQRMSRLVERLLALARADAGQQLSRTAVRIDEIVRTVHREVQPLAQQVAVRIDRIAAIQVMGDPDALKQLLLILVENGIKYTPAAGEVTIGLALESRDVVLSVTDTGCGISPEDIPRLFERFFRAATARSSGGTGLGLAIAQWIVEEHGGAIHVTSQLGAGSTFAVRLPGRLVVAAPAASERAVREIVPTS